MRVLLSGIKKSFKCKNSGYLITVSAVFICKDLHLANCFFPIINIKRYFICQHQAPTDEASGCNTCNTMCGRKNVRKNNARRNLQKGTDKRHRHLPHSAKISLHGICPSRHYIIKRHAVQVEHAKTNRLTAALRHKHTHNCFCAEKDGQTQKRPITGRKHVSI